MSYIHRSIFFVAFVFSFSRSVQAQIIPKLKHTIVKSWQTIFNDSSSNHLYLFAGGNFSGQRILTQNFISSFNYTAEEVQKSYVKPGLSVGARIDGIFKSKLPFALLFSLNNYTAGANYKSFTSLPPYLGNFTHFKADNQFFTVGVAAHVKKILPISDTTKHRFYIVGGPHIERRLSNQSLDNQVIQAYHRWMIRANLGIEFDNNAYYTLYIHYHQPIYSFTNHIRNAFTTLELGVVLRASDLF